jgi:hypothetical protein
MMERVLTASERPKLEVDMSGVRPHTYEADRLVLSTIFKGPDKTGLNLISAIEVVGKAGWDQ